MRWARGCALFISACIAASHSAADFGDYQSHRLDGQSVTLTTSIGTLQLTLQNPTSIYAHYRETGIRQLPSFALAGPPAPTTAVIAETDSKILFGSARIRAIVDKQTMTIAYELDGVPIVAEEHGYYATETLRGFRFSLQASEKIMGGGERVLGMNRRGHKMPLYNRAHYGYTDSSSQMYYSLPAVMSTKRYSIVFDNSATGTLDIGADEPDVLRFEARAGRTAYLVSAESSYPDLIDTLTAAIGRQPLLPRWAFGNFASRFGYRSEAQTRDTVQRFRDADIPLDAVVLDLYWFGRDIKGHVGNLAWDRSSFPTAEQMIAAFAEDGIQTIVISEPFVLTTSKRWDEAVSANVLATDVTGKPRTFDFYFGNTGLIDVFNDAARQWLGSVYRDLYRQGVAGVWGDLGEPEVHPDNTIHTLSDTDQRATADEVHNVFGHEWARFVFEQHQRDFPDRRAFIMMRAGFAGTQRYGIVPWTGDVDRSWGGLRSQVELSLQMGLFGLGYIHSDIGGFAGGEKFDRELYLRWLQMGAFQPVFRPHAQEHIAPEPVFHDRLTQRIARDYIKLRYRLLPYLSTLAWEHATTGLPLVRPAFFADDSQQPDIANTQSYLFGDAFFVTPVTERRKRRQQIQVPPGVWFNYWTDAAMSAGVQQVKAPLDQIPLLVRAGAFVPMVAAVNRTRDYSSAAMTLHYYDHDSVSAAQASMYEDDGKDPAALTSAQYDLLSFSAQRAGDELTVIIKRGDSRYAGAPVSRDIELIIHNVVSADARVHVDGTPRADVTYDSNTRQLTIPVTQTNAPITVDIGW
ncbi:MAG: TIM-barrel domain-containing protein [Pseudomonadota bacterium]